MAYEPLHHKYRPQALADLVGQEAIATTLASALKTERIAPAYLLTGARGTGKTSTARIMAKSLNCLSYDAPTPTPCGKCEMCLSIIRGNALDVTEIDAASNTGVDNIRDLIERSQFAPVQARYKVYAIDECHMLSTSAFNALLKTLEEPPDRVVFILATTDPQRVLPTIISRCQRFDFRRIPLDSMVKHLQKIANIEKIDINSEALTLVGQIAQGGLRDAESLLDQLSLQEGTITVEAVWDLVGSVPEQDLLTLLEAIALSNSSLVLTQLRHIMDRGREPLVVLQNLAGFYRDLLIAKTAGDRQDLVALTAGTWARLKQIAQDFALASILAGQQHLRSAETQIRQTTQPRLWLEVTVLSINNVPSAIAPQTMTREPQTMTHEPQTMMREPQTMAREPQTMTREPQTMAREPQTMTREPQTMAREPQSIDQSNLAYWHELLQHLPTPTRSIFKDNATFLEINFDNVIIGLSPNILKDVAVSKRKDLQNYCIQIFQRQVEVKFKFVSPAAVPSKPTLSPVPIVKPPAQATPIIQSNPITPTELYKKPELAIAEPESPKPLTPITENSQAVQRVADFFQGQVINLT